MLYHIENSNKRGQTVDSDEVTHSVCMVFANSSSVFTFGTLELIPGPEFIKVFPCSTQLSMKF